MTLLLTADEVRKSNERRAKKYRWQHGPIFGGGRKEKDRGVTCQELDAVDAIAEDDGLVDLKLRKKRVEAVHFLPLLHESVVLQWGGDVKEA